MYFPSLSLLLLIHLSFLSPPPPLFLSLYLALYVINWKIQIRQKGGNLGLEEQIVMDSLEPTNY